MRFAPARTLSLLLALSSLAAAAEPAKYLKGTKVLPKLDMPIQAGGRNLDIWQLELPWNVAEVKDDLILVDERNRYWVQREQVVTLDEAGHYFCRQIAEQRQPALAFFLRGVAAELTGQVQPAIADFDQSLRLEVHAGSLHWRGASHSFVPDIGKALADLNTAALLEPENAAILSSCGRVRTQAGQYDEAIADLTEAIRLDPTQTDAYRFRGFARTSLGQFEPAIADYDKVVSINRDDIEAQLSRGGIFLQLCKYDNAVAAFAEVIRIDPQRGEGHLGRAKGWRAIGNADKAMADLSEALRLNPSNDDALYERALVWIDQQEPAKALDDLNETARLRPHEAVVFETRAGVHVELEQYDEAVRDLDECIRLDPSCPRPYLARGQVWIAKAEHLLSESALMPEPANPPQPVGEISEPEEVNAGNVPDPDAERNDPSPPAPTTEAATEHDGEQPGQDLHLKAIADFSKYIELAPDEAAGYLWRASAWEALAKTDEALADYTAAIEREPEDHELFTRRAQLWQLKDEVAKAVADFTAAIRLNPQDAEGYAARAHARDWKHDLDNVLLDMAQAIKLDRSTAERFAFRALDFSGGSLDPKAAVVVATRACEATGWSDSILCSVLSALCTRTGDLESAAKYKRKAIDLGASPRNFLPDGTVMFWPANVTPGEVELIFPQPGK